MTYDRLLSVHTLDYKASGCGIETCKWQMFGRSIMSVCVLLTKNINFKRM